MPHLEAIQSHISIVLYTFLKITIFNDVHCVKAEDTDSIRK